VVEGILEGAGAAVVGGLIVGSFTITRRLWHTPQRLDRIERLVPPLLRAVQALLIAAKRGAANGEVDDSIEELKQLTTDGMISQKERG
jgi:hypothetical protein